MREFVTFSSNDFSKARKPHHINRVCQCEDLAVWLRSRLEDQLSGGSLTSYQEDFGWVIEIPSPGRTGPIVVVANLDDDADDTDEFGVYVEGVGKAADTDRVDAIEAIDRALHAEPTIERIEWWNGGFMVGEPSPAP